MKNFLLKVMEVSQEPMIFLKGALVFAIGSLNHQVGYLLLAMGIDLVFGIQVALKNKEFKWSTLFLKFRKKVLTYMLWVSMFHSFDKVAGLPDTARWSVIVLLMGLEIMSAIKNTSRLGHSQLAEALETLYLTLKPGGGAVGQVSKPPETKPDEPGTTTDEPK